MKGQNQLVEKVFRYEYGRIMAILVHRFGPAHLEKIEDAVQDALIKAMQLWAYRDPPDNPTAWLLRVAGNRFIDMVRRDTKMVFDESYLKGPVDILPADISLENSISDSQLKMIFACCHPSLPVAYQLILSLKLIGGFGNREIARVLLKKEETVAKSFTRARKKLKDAITTLEIPVEMGLQSRLFVVLRVIYLLFSEGYSPATGALAIRRDICYEAIRLSLLLQDNPYCRHPNLNALIALMCFHVSRFDARLDNNLELVDMEHQDRSKYDRALITIGIRHLENSGTTGRVPSSYHLEAAVSYYHCTAATFADTDWKNILKLYDLQMEQNFSPMVALNRVVPFYKVYGAEKAWILLQQYRDYPNFKENALYHAIAAELLASLKEMAAAREALMAAISITQNELEKKHLRKKLRHLDKDS